MCLCACGCRCVSFLYPWWCKGCHRSNDVFVSSAAERLWVSIIAAHWRGRLRAVCDRCRAFVALSHTTATQQLWKFPSCADPVQRTVGSIALFSRAVHLHVCKPSTFMSLFHAYSTNDVTIYFCVRNRHHSGGRVVYYGRFMATIWWAFTHKYTILTQS